MAVRDDEAGHYEDKRLRLARCTKVESVRLPYSSFGGEDIHRQHAFRLEWTNGNVEHFACSRATERVLWISKILQVLSYFSVCPFLILPRCQSVMSSASHRVQHPSQNSQMRRNCCHQKRIYKSKIDGLLTVIEHLNPSQRSLLLLSCPARPRVANFLQMSWTGYLQMWNA